MLLSVKNYLWVVYTFVKDIVTVFHICAYMLANRVQGSKLYNV